MIAPKIVDEVRRLLAEGKLSQRKIAKRLQISRGTVGAIAAGRRPDYQSRKPIGRQNGFPEPAGPPRRCPGCGGMVYVPCRLCRTRELAHRRNRQPTAQEDTRPGDPLAINLHESQRHCYEQILARKADAARTVAPPEPDPALTWDDQLDDELVLSETDLLDAFEWED